MQMLKHNLFEQRTIGMPASCGETLFLEGEPCDEVFEIRKGMARAVSMSREGERQILAFFFPGDFIGLPLSRHHRYSVEAVTDLVHVRHSTQRWQESLARTCQEDSSMLKSVWREEKAFIERGLILGRVGALARLSAFLIVLSKHLPTEHGLCALELPQTDIASYLAASPETVCRGLKRLREMQIIAMPRRDRFAIQYPARLELLAEGILA
ncbi:helix-turn-helix domain-containing protein [Altererythrobacter gangjinensis]|uniref:Helix-turn-helix domain-containing protein n=2 Tax=Pontixanthobacter gangjinensis TaxID=1028742 RepID=A0A6I4SQ24_9SPHN|nr:helix-turn-helix domain-containing protein [Pontixanthobacter gangjinensis]